MKIQASFIHPHHHVTENLDDSFVGGRENFDIFAQLETLLNSVIISRENEP